MNSDEQFAAYLCGLFDGEGCFRIQRTAKIISAQAFITLRCDDWRILRECRDRTGLGTVVSRLRADVPESHRPTITWYVLRVNECAELLRILDLGGGLRAKKARDVEIWRQAVEILATVGGGYMGTGWPQLEDLSAQLHDVKKFDPAYARGWDQIKSVSAGGIKRNPERLLHYKRLTHSQGEEIVRLRDSGNYTQKEIAEMFGVTPMVVSRIVNGQYRSLPASERAIKGRLTLQQIEELVSRHKAGERPKNLQGEFSVSRPQYYRYINGQFDSRYHRPA